MSHIFYAIIYGYGCITQEPFLDICVVVFHSQVLQENDSFVSTQSNSYIGKMDKNKM